MKFKKTSCLEPLQQCLDICCHLNPAPSVFPASGTCSCKTPRSPVIAGYWKLCWPGHLQTSSWAHLSDAAAAAGQPGPVWLFHRESPLETLLARTSEYAIVSTEHAGTGPARILLESALPLQGSAVQLHGRQFSYWIVFVDMCQLEPCNANQPANGHIAHPCSAVVHTP